MVETVGFYPKQALRIFFDAIRETGPSFTVGNGPGDAETGASEVARESKQRQARPTYERQLQLGN